MTSPKTVGVRKLKNELSAYIREIKTGKTILVTEHGKVVAELCPPSSSYDQIRRETQKQEWITSGKLIVPSKPLMKITKTGHDLPEGTAQRLLDNDRRDN